MKVALLLTTLAFAVTSTLAIDCHCFNRCGYESRQCFDQLQYKQRDCHDRCHNDWDCYHRCVDQWVEHCNHQRRECLKHCDNHHNNRCYHEVLEPINVMPEVVEDDEQPATATP